MRWIYLAVIVLFVAATTAFALQNLEGVNLSFLGFNVRAPLALLIAAVYLVGAATGGSLLVLLRRSYEGSRQNYYGLVLTRLSYRIRQHKYNCDQRRRMAMEFR